MAMLAEPRRKNKYSVDPRGLNWSKDEDKFGQKMLERMGWQQGKGLGAKEDGNVDHVAVRHKSDNKGVGCSKSHVDNWIAHQDDFNALLSSLNESGDTGMKESDDVTSLEQKSKSSKARVHYMKFTKGKDLSSKKNTDLDCVFGRRKSKSAPASPQAQSENEASDKSDSEETEVDMNTGLDKSHGVVTTTNSLSVADYFAKKMLEVKARLKQDTGSPAKDHDSPAFENQGLSMGSDNEQNGMNGGNHESAVLERIGQWSKVTDKMGLLKAHTAPGCLESLESGQSDGKKDRLETLSDDEKGKKKAKKSKKCKKRKAVETNGEFEKETVHFNIGDVDNDDGEMDKPKKKKRKTKKDNPGETLDIEKLENNDVLSKTEVGEDSAKQESDKIENSEEKSKYKDKIRKKRQKRKRRKEETTDRDDYVKIPSCLNKKQLKEERERRKEMGFKGSNLGEVVGYGLDGLLNNARNGELAKKKKKKKKTKKQL